MTRPDEHTSQRGRVRRALALLRPYVVPAAFGVAVAVAAAALTSSVADGVLIGLVSFAAALVVRAFDRGEHHEWIDPPDLSYRGARREVTALSWTFTGRDGRITEAALRRLRDDARRRLALRSVHLPVGLADADQIPPALVTEARSVLGGGTWDLLTARGVLPPTVRQAEQCITTLESLVPPTDDGALTVPPRTHSTHGTPGTHSTDGRTPA